MHPVRKQRLLLLTFILVFSSLAIGLIVFALRDNLNLFYPPAKLVDGTAPVETTIRGGGCVVPGSVSRDQESLKVNFLITDGLAEVGVRYQGILPDLFAEGEAVVVNGMLTREGIFEAKEVLAKHDENYMPPEVAESIAQGEGAEHQKTCGVMSYDS
ncbi:cytochrome c maturation protein CcmE [Simiduia sp. 21SJ11W-1]|uniref:cytochrome c maturation protein CcmE n=1 Tax=Simiduia sp. 21SJ11W-1 TaxID=2909669 RepID=UPI0020A0121B|nr:cytochrome c maturation protein CcmE [Simiduia sp. 21SJ11W-1]UTA46523.1 cytochrome c maturation protein CcmE [Simiduia sp. 21SJ11W-1]